MANPHPKTDHLHGRPKGAKNLVQASVKAALADVVSEDPEKIREAIRRGCAARPPFSAVYLKLAAEYLDTKPAETLEHTGNLTHVHEHFWRDSSVTA